MPDPTPTSPASPAPGPEGSAAVELQGDNAYARLFPRRPRIGIWIAAVLILLALTAAGLFLIHGLTRRQPIASSGGLYFHTAIDIPGFRQGDPRWRDDQLGDTEDTIAQTGCAISSAAMVLASYGVDTDPQRLNRYLKEHHGYVGAGYLVWEKAAELAGSAVQKAYEDAPSYWEIDRQLLRRNPVIVRIHFPRGGMHFVVIAGKAGFDYLIRDPGAGWKKGLYPLKELTPRIDGLRYYIQIAPVPAGPSMASAAASPEG